MRSSPTEASFHSIIKPISNYLLVGVALSISNPIDFVRIRMQVMQELIKQGKLGSPYQNSLDCCLRVLKEQGKTAFWKGNFSTLLKFYPTEALNWFLKQLYQSAYQKIGKQAHQTQTNFLVNYLGGALAGLTARTLLYPLEFTKNSLSAQLGRQGRGIWGCLRDSFRQDGLRGIYKGASISLVGVTIFRSTYFGIYDTFKENASNSLQRWGVSYIASLAAICLTYPSDTIRRRLMVTGSSSSSYRGFKDCALKIWRSEGCKGFFSGSPVILLQGATSATIYFIFDKIIKDVKMAKQ